MQNPSSGQEGERLEAEFLLANPSRGQEDERLNAEFILLPPEIKRCIINILRLIQEEVRKEEREEYERIKAEEVARLKTMYNGIEGLILAYG